MPFPHAMLLPTALAALTGLQVVASIHVVSLFQAVSMVAHQSTPPGHSSRFYPNLLVHKYALHSFTPKRFMLATIRLVPGGSSARVETITPVML